MGDLSLIQADRDAFKEKYTEVYPDAKKGSIAKSCYYKVGYSICTAFEMRQVGIYTADLRLVYHISTKNKSLQTNVKINLKALAKSI